MITQWPPDYRAEWNRRAVIRNRCEREPFFRDCLQTYYKNNPIAWIEDNCVTFDPRRKGSKLMPFVLFPRQKEFITYLYQCYVDKESGLVEKSRDIGASWLCCAFSIWLWLYHPGSVIGWGSRTSSYVDQKGDPKSIFTKLRQIIANLPHWMIPHGFYMKEHATYMRIVNPANGSAITGEGGDNMGRGGRTSIYFKDESAHYEHPELVEAALGDNTDVQIDISSVNGSANVFYYKRMSGVEWRVGETIPKGILRVFIFDWSDHPGKTIEWFNQREEKARREGLLHIFRQEVCRDYSGSIDRIIIQGEWVRAAIDAHIKLGMQMDGEKIAAQDVADGGGDKNALCIRHGVVTLFAEHWGGESQDAAHVAVPYCTDYNVHELYYDSASVGTGFKGEINHMRENGQIPHNMIVMPWNGGSRVLDATDNIIPNDSQSPTNEDQYANLKAQSWYRLRARFYKTYRAVKHAEIYDHGELISISSELTCLNQLTMELSQATYTTNPKGKMLVEKKPNGANSPNIADSMVMCYSPTRELSILDVI